MKVTFIKRSLRSNRSSDYHVIYAEIKKRVLLCTEFIAAPVLIIKVGETLFNTFIYFLNQVIIYKQNVYEIKVYILHLLFSHVVSAAIKSRMPTSDMLPHPSGKLSHSEMLHGIVKQIKREQN